MFMLLRSVCFSGFALLLASLAQADAGSVWSLAPDGQVTGQVGTWERQGQQARFQWLGSQAGLDVNLQQPTAGSTNDVYLFTTYVRNVPRRASNFFSSARPRVGPASQPYGRGRYAVEPAFTTAGELALDVRTFTGQSIDGAWRAVEIPPRTHAAISPRYGVTAPEYGPWQPLRFVIERP